MAKYKDKLVYEVQEWVAANGLIERGGADLASFLRHFGISDTCHRKWLKLRPRYAEAIENGREIFQRNAATTLVRSLFESAKGGYHEETQEVEDTRYIPDKDGKPIIREMVKRKTKSNRYSPPNTGAAIFLLTNLDPENWQNRQKQDLTIKQDDEKAMTLEDIEREIERINKLDKGEKD